MTSVSVIIPCYNAASFIGQTLDSVFGQEGVEPEVIVVDDGSTDDSAAVIRSKYPRVTLIETPNQGPSAARNLGTSAASADLIQYLDADDLLAPGKLAAQATLLESTGADVAYGDWIRFTLAVSGEMILLDPVRRQLGDRPEIELLTADFWAPPAVYLMRRSIVEKACPWRPNLPVIQDARFMLDCAMHGARFVRCEGLMAYYRVHQEGSVSTRSRAAFLRDCLLNAGEVYDLWRSQGALDLEHRRAIAAACDHIAVGSFENDPATFAAASALITQAMPGYIPERPPKRRIAARLLGYGRAIALAHHIRKWKSAIQ